MRGDVELDAAQFAVTEHLDRLVLADRAGRDQSSSGRDRAALGEQLGQPADVHDLVLDPERGSGSP